MTQPKPFRPTKPGLTTLLWGSVDYIKTIISRPGRFQIYYNTIDATYFDHWKHFITDKLDRTGIPYKTVGWGMELSWKNNFPFDSAVETIWEFHFTIEYDKKK